MLLPFEALNQISQVLYEGFKKYGRDNWRRIGREDHVEHALRHLVLYSTLGNDEDLQHAATRLLFALSTPLEGKYNDYESISHSTD